MRTDTSLDVKELLEENIRLSKAILVSAEKTRKSMRWMKVMGILRVLIIVVPLILAILYLPPFLSKLSDTFGKLYGGEQFNIINQLKNPNGSAGAVTDQIKKLLENQK